MQQTKAKWPIPFSEYDERISQCKRQDSKFPIVLTMIFLSHLLRTFRFQIVFEYSTCANCGFLLIDDNRDNIAEHTG